MSQLQTAYEELLSQHGLTEYKLSFEAATEAFEAMADAGWFDQPEMNLDREQCRNHIFAGTKNALSAYEPLLQHLATGVGEGFRRIGRPIPCPVLVRGFPLGESNARVKPVADGALILFNHGFMNLLYQIGKVLILSYDWLFIGHTSEGQVVVGESTQLQEESATEVLNWNSVGWTHEQTVQALNAILYAYVRDQSVQNAPRQILPTGERALTLASLVTYAELFVLAHEYAHVVLGHCDEVLTDVSVPSGTLHDVVARTREQEFEADELAARVLMALPSAPPPNQEFDKARRAAGTALVLSLAALLAVTFHGPIGFGLEAGASDTHPTANARMLRILQFLHDTYGFADSRLARACMGWLQGVVEQVALSVAHLKESIAIEEQAQSFYERGDYTQAAPLFRQVITIREAALGQWHLSLAAPLGNVGNCISQCGHLPDAEQCFVRALSICERAGRRATQYIAMSLNNVAVHYANRGRHEEAVPFFERGLQEAESRLESDFQSFAVVVWNFLFSLQELKRSHEVHDLHRRSVFLVRRTFGFGETQDTFLYHLGRLANQETEPEGER